MSPKEIRELLVLKEWSRADLAELLGITSNTVSRWFCETEPHRRHPNHEHVEKMSAWLVEARKAAWEATKVARLLQSA